MTLHNISANVLPSKGKHYGTTVDLTVDNQVYKLNLWIPVGRPSAQELSDWNITPDDWDRNVEVDNGWDGKEPIQSMFPCDNHFQSELELEIAQYIADAINALRSRLDENNEV